MSEQIPEGWERKSLDDLTSLVEVRSEYHNQYEPLTSSRGGLVRQRDYFKKQVTSGDNSGYKVVSYGDFTFRAMSEYGVFKFNCSKFKDKGIVSPAYDVFRSKNCDGNYLAYVLDSDVPTRLIYSIAQGGTRLALKYRSLRKLEFSIPPLPEQKKIASILSSVDEVIESTKKQIDKLQDLKKATMNELLTKGIGHTEFRDSELGRIPKEWQTTEIGQITREISDGGTPDTSNRDYFGGDIPWVVIDDIQPRIYKTATCITDLGLSKSSAKLWDSGTIILSTRATIGRLGIAMKSMATNQGICGVVPVKNIDVNYLYYSLASLKRQLNILSQGSTIKEIRPPTLAKIGLNLPPLPEQKKIADILTSINAAIGSTQKKIGKFQDLKKALMQDLLTGRVRVRVD